jgi:mono/diheme cytochrome c family protein
MLKIAVAGLVLAGCTSEQSEEVASAPTYYRDVQPIIQDHCVACHQPGEIGDGHLTSYEEVRALGPIIRGTVETRLMPPWLADPGCNEFAHDPSLSDEQIATIGAWVDAGMPAGDPADAPQEQKSGEGGMSRVDHTLALPVAYEPVLSPDDYRCFLIDWPEDEVRYVTGFGVSPDNKSSVHHVIAFVAPPSQVSIYEGLDAAEQGPGYTCYGGPGGPQDGSTGFLGAWAPGTPPSDLPAGTGIRMAPGSKLIVQVHYNLLSWDGEPDRTAIDVKVDPTVEHEAQWAFFANPAWIFSGQMPIAAGEADATHSFSMDPTDFLYGGRSFYIHQAGLHMHTRGTEATLDIVRGGAGESCLLDIPRWDFNWQFPYRFKEPAIFNPGDQLRIICHWDNSRPQSVGGRAEPPRDLNWGEGTNDEMCLGMLYVTPQ